MNRLMKIELAAMVLLAAAGIAAAQTAASGFNVQDLIMKLSLYLPEDVAPGARAFGAPSGGAGVQAQAGGGAQAPSPQAQGSGTQNAPAGQGAAQPRAQFQYTRDQKLYLTRDQTSKLIPILQGLRENPLPSPTKARKIESDVAAILTAGQKSEYDKYQKAMEKFRQNLQQSGTARSGTGQQPQSFQNMTDAQRQEFINSLPAEQRQQFQQRAAQGGQAGTGGAQLSQTERRQRQLDEFITVLQNWEKKAK
jgi:hypothetical protein